MGPRPGRSTRYDLYRFSGLGCMFAGAVLLFMGGGWLLDRWLGLVPLFTILGALLGAALASVSVYRSLGIGDPRRRKPKGPGQR